MKHRHVATVGAITAIAVTAAVGLGPAAFASHGRGLHLTNHLDTFTPVDMAPTGPSAGDAFYLGSHVVDGAQGRIGASCVLVTTSAAGIRSCEVDFVLRQGTITTRGVTDSATQSVTLVVTGGTGRFVNAHGSGTLTPTRAGSTVDLNVR